MKSLFGGAYDGARVLVTGHTGFKGSWLCLWLTALGAKVTGLALTPPTSPAHWDLLSLNDVDDIRGDIRQLPPVISAFKKSSPEIVFHLAAQPLVRASYADPLTTFQTNVLGLAHVLEASRSTSALRAFVNVTTDKVYRDQNPPVPYEESMPLGGHDPYSTSKACAELVGDCYEKSFFASIAGGVRLASARAGNVIGGGDWAQDRLIPDLVRSAMDGPVARIRNPSAIRPWQHVLEPLAGYLRLGQRLLAGEDVGGAWNFGPSPTDIRPVSSVVSSVQASWAAIRTEIEVEPQPREAQVLMLDSSRAEVKLGWRGIWSAEQAVERTATWYRRYAQDGLVSSARDLGDYVECAREKDQSWAT